jgi:hypothetical protein
MDKYFFVFDRGHKKDIEEITQDDYLLLKQAKNYLTDLMSIEEHLNSVIENYVEFERELYNCSLVVQKSPERVAVKGVSNETG